MQPVPLTILTGFLGAGKTTLLNRLLNAPHGLKIAVMVNDFGSINIDSQLITAVDADTVSLSNGCVCCTIRGDLLQATLDLLNRPEPPQAIILETSGVSDPIEVVVTYKQLPRVRIDSVLTVIDAEQILDLAAQARVLAMNQIGTADIVILNKVDLVQNAQKQAVRAFVQDIAPKARILEAVNADVPLEILLDVGLYQADNHPRESLPIHVHEAGDHDHDHDHPDHSLLFNTYSWRSPHALSGDALQRMINHLPTSVYRAKGILYLVESPYRAGVLQVVGKRASIAYVGKFWENETPYSQLVFIGAPDSLDPDWLNAQLEACLAQNQKSLMTRMTEAFTSWLRPRH